MKLAPTGAPALPSWINGRALLTVTQTYHDVPGADGETLRKVPLTGQDEVEVAVSTARAAVAAWLAVDEGERGAILHRLGDALAQYAGHFAQLIEEDTGVSAAAATQEVSLACACLKGEHDRLLAVGAADPVLALTGPRQPLLGAVSLAASLLRQGHGVVLHPHRNAPAVAVALGELATRAGVVDGAWNVLLGGDEALAALKARNLPRVAAGEAGFLADQSPLDGQVLLGPLAAA